MPGNHGEITVDEQNGGDNVNEKKTRKKKKKKEEDDDGDDSGSGNQLETPSITKPRKRFLSKIRRKPKSPKRSLSRSGSRKVGCFSGLRPRRKEEECPSSPLSDPNDESFTDEMLRVMLETNDFSSNDCNPHR